MAARKPAKTVAFNNKYYVIVIRVILLVASDFSRPLLLTLNFFSFGFLSRGRVVVTKIGHHFRPNSNREEDRHVVLGFRDDWRPKRRRNHETRLHRASFLFSFLFFRGLFFRAPLSRGAIRTRRRRNKTPTPDGVMVSNVISPKTRGGPRAFKASSSNLLFTDTR